MLSPFCPGFRDSARQDGPGIEVPQEEWHSWVIDFAKNAYYKSVYVIKDW